MYYSIQCHIAVYRPRTTRYCIAGIQCGWIVQAKGSNQPWGKQDKRRISQGRTSQGQIS